MTVYNDVCFVENAVESILKQTFADFELVIVNDGSTDGTSELLDHLSEKDHRIRVIHQQNKGTAYAANAGLVHCRGEYIARLDSDDYSYPERLAIETTFLDKHPEIVLVGGACHISDCNGNIIGTRNICPKNLEKTLWRRCIYQQSDVMFRKSVLVNFPTGEVYRTKLKAEDYDLWLRLSELGEIAKIDSVLGIWRLNKGGYTLSRKEEQIESAKIVRKMAALRRKGLSDGYDAYRQTVVAKEHRNVIEKIEYDLVVSQVLIKEGRTKEAKHLLLPYNKIWQDWVKVKNWYRLACLPVPVVKMLFSAREFVLNHSSIELR